MTDQTTAASDPSPQQEPDRQPVEVTGGLAAAVSAVRESHARFSALVAALPAEQLTAPSYASEWSIAQVASHLGSQAEIFGLFLDAGLGDGVAPGGEAFQQIWARWDAMKPSDQVTSSVAANDQFVARLEETAQSGGPFSLDLFGSRQDLEGLARMRLSEHALHTWDVAVALDPEATVSADAVALIVDGLAPVAGRAGRAVDGADPVIVATTDPAARYEVTLSPEVGIAASDTDASTGDLHLTAEAWVRLVYGRLDPASTPSEVRGDSRIDTLRAAFPGF